MMKTEEIIENNKLIAEFMEYKLVDCHSPFLGKAWRKENLNNSPLYKLMEGNAENNIWFHSSWDWIMPVVEKVESLVSSFDISYSKYPSRLSSIDISICTKLNGIDSEFKTITNKSKSKIESVYVSVVEFIKWHNKQIK